MVNSKSDASNTFDLIVVGGGSGGLSSAKRAASHGARVALIERDRLGGTCVNRGCVPKKLMWMTARQRIEAAEHYQMDIANEPRIDFGQMQTRITDHLVNLNSMFENQLSDAGITLVRGAAEISGIDDIRVNGTSYTTDKLLLATGARPKRLDIQGADLADVSDDVFLWTRLPDTLVIIGGGYIGCEFASILNALGVDVTLVNEDDRLLDQFARSAGQLAKENMQAQGVEMHLGVTPDRLEKKDDHLVTHLSDGTSLKSERILLATGRQPNVDKLGSICKALEVAKSGALAIDAEFTTSVKDVFAVGDSADRLPLTPVATRDGTTFADQQFGPGATQVDLDKVPSAVFVYPPVAQVGTVPDDIELTYGDGLASGVLKPEGHGCNAYAHHFVGDTLAGTTLVHASAAELIAPFGVLVKAAGSKAMLTKVTGVHPTFAEELLGR
ncbi:dihydrolipoyl dehydrogenase family protein [Marivita sp. S2033]|uniref:dihydrolipoyl dehydrogenase family protein n=1 Tax=Marivita sp. S2033 TaxID=3373187 RepID=UPI003982BBF9